MYYSEKVTVLLLAEPEYPVLFYLVKTKAHRKISLLYSGLLNPHTAVLTRNPFLMTPPQSDRKPKSL